MGAVFFATLLGMAVAQDARENGDGGEGAQEAREIQIQLVAPRPPETIVARAGGEPITLGALHDYYELWSVPIQPQVEPQYVPQMPDEWIDALGRLYSIARMSEMRVGAMEGPAQKAVYETIFEQWLLSYVLEVLTEREILNRVKDPSEAEIAEYFEAHREEFFRPESFSIRQIFLMTYEPYKVRSGDTPESIAAEIGGDVARVGDIRADVPSRPRRWVAPEERNRRLFNPLYIGEKLLVPMKEERAQEVKARLEKILARLGEGTTFEALAAMASEAETAGQVIGPLPSGARPLVGGLADAVEKTAVGEVSEIFRSEHGFHAVEVLEKTAEGYRAVEDVRGEIVDLSRKKQQEQYDRDLSFSLFSMPELTIEYEALERAPELAKETVVLRVLEREFTWEKFQPVWNARLSKNATRERITDSVRYFPPVQYALALIWAEQSKLWDEPEAVSLYRTLRTAVLAKEYFERETARRAAMAVDDDAVRDFYENNTEVFSIPAKVSYEVVELRPEAGFHELSARQQRRELKRLVRELEDRLKGAESIRDFLALADELNQATEGETAGGNGLLRQQDAVVNELAGPTGETVRGLSEGEWSEPYIEEGAVRAVAVTKRTEEQIPAFEKVSEQIKAGLTQQYGQDLGIELLRELQGRANYESLLETPVAEAVPSEAQ